MKTKSFLTIISLLLSSLATFAIANAQNATLTIDTSKTGPRLSPLQHGIFFEEINHAGDGGLYPEKLRNRSFAEGTAHWATTGGATMTVSGSVLTVTTTSTPGSVRTEGYWGIGIEKGKKLRFVADIAGAKGVTARLISSEGEVLAIGKSGGDFVPTKTHAKALLEILVPANSTITLAYPSLLPLDTFGKSKVRKDLGQLVAGMKPSFVRFPGGCFIEGDTLALRFNWRNSIGPVDMRTPTQCIWGYKATNGLGFHEYLQWTEDSGATAMFVISAGMSHKDVVPMNEMDGILQEALDALEYANGDAKTTKFGAMRAKNGHPAPFGLNLIEIGNENGGPRYDERYKFLYDGIKKKYPKVRTIADLWGGLPKSAPIETIDEHYYDTPQFFLNQANRYDKYDRNGPKIYVGEYAVTIGSGKGNLIAALGEAAFITGMERNSDVVIMASYAPLFVNDNNRAWNPNAIVFDSSRSYGTPSYWVQRLFSENRGTVNLTHTLTPLAAPPAPIIVHKGGVGVATWATEAEFADVKVNGESVKLTPGRGRWETSPEGTLRQRDAGGEDLRALGGDPNAQNYTLTLRAKKLGGREGFLIPFYVKDKDNYLWWNIGGWGNTQFQVEHAVNGSKTTLIRPDVPGSVETNRWYDIKIVCEGAHVQCFLDNKKIHDFLIPAPQSAPVLHSVVTKDEKSGDILVKIVNAGEQAQPIKITLAGQTKLTGTGSVTVLAGVNPMDENSFDNPTRITPVTFPLKNITPTFTYKSLPYSVAILRLKMGK
jgi:alpha-L-arabinofuranosidase